MKKFDHISGQHFKIDDADIYCESIGDEKEPALLFLHGALGNIEDFNGIIAELPDQYRIIGIDSRGHGKSTLGSKELSYELLQKDIEKILSHLNVSELTIIGFSNGGTVAYRLGATNHLKINQIVTIGSPWHTKHLEHLMEGYSAITGDIWKKHAPLHFQSYNQLNPKPNFDVFFQQCKSMALDKSSAGRPNESVKNISCPLLIVRGENDPIVTHADIIELSTLIENSFVLNIPSAGHEAFLHQKEIFTEHLKKFLRITNGP